VARGDDVDQACELQACELDACELQACELEACELQACELQACELRACEVHAELLVVGVDHAWVCEAHPEPLELLVDDRYEHGEDNHVNINCHVAEIGVPETATGDKAAAKPERSAAAPMKRIPKDIVK